MRHTAPQNSPQAAGTLRKLQQRVLYRLALRANSRHAYAHSFLYAARAAQYGSGDALLLLAQHNITGLGIEKNERMGFLWYSRLAQEGNAQAQYECGQCYAAGLGVQQDVTQALCWYKKAAEQGYSPARSSFSTMHGA